MRKLSTSYGTTAYIFDSVKEVVEACNRHLYQPVKESKAGMSLPKWEDILAALDKPWKEGLETVERFVKEIEEKSNLPELRYVRRRIGFDENDGDEIDLDRLRAGQPYWRISRRESVVGPTEVTIVTDLAAPILVDPQDILWRGAVAIAMAKVLEDRGYSVALWVTRTSCPYESLVKGKGQCDEWQRVLIAVCLKEAGDRLDLSTLTNAVSAWFYRTVLFTLTRTIAAKEGKRLAKGLGLPQTPYTSELDLFTKDENRLYSMSAFNEYAAQAAVEYGLRKVKESQEPPAYVYDDTTGEADAPPDRGEDSSQQRKQETPPPTPPKRKMKPEKVRKVKMPKLPTEL